MEADEDFHGVAQTIINPAIVMKDWGEAGVEVKIDGKPVERGKDFRVGYEETNTGKDLILWFRMTSTKPTRFTLTPASN